MTLAIEMPEMNGIEVLEAMEADSKTGVIVLNSLTVRGGEMTLRALDLGAFGFVSGILSKAAAARRPARSQFASCSGCQRKRFSPEWRTRLCR
jgi:chemotaxis response regulator CheB